MYGLVVLLLHFLLSSFPSLSSSSSLSLPNFQVLNVHQTLLNQTRSAIAASKTKSTTKLLANQSADPKWRLRLLHRDNFPFVRFRNHRHRLHARLRRDADRVSAITRRISGQTATTTATAEAKYDANDDFGSDVVSGMDQGSGEYFVRIGVGSPPRDQYMVIDSGSDIVWVQCQPCKLCYKQSDPVFNPAESASYTGVSCRSSVCDRIDNADCHSGGCRYSVMYGDGSYTKGTLALETLTFGGTMVRNVAIGCGHSNRGMFIGAAGLLGLGDGSMSFVGQLGGQSGGAFSYCLVSRGSDSTGSLVFGREALPVGATWVPLLRNPQSPSFYYVGLMGLGVAGERVPLPEDIFRLTETGEGGVVMDTGTAVTRLPPEAYTAFRDAFTSQTANLPRASGVSIFDTCYDLSGFVSVRVPTVSFYFTGGPVLTLPARSFLIPADDSGTYCFAFAATQTRLSIIGNIQQEGIQVSFDGANGFVGFGPNVC